MNPPGSSEVVTFEFVSVRGVHADYVLERTDDVETMGDDGPPEQPDRGIDLDDEEFLEWARSAENGDRFEALRRGDTAGYDSHSEADMAPRLHLAFWTGGDPSRMDALFRRSGLMREKWDEVHYAGGATYGERTIERALEWVDEVYEPASHSDGNRWDDSKSPCPIEAGREIRDETSSKATQDESVYLEERNRLLREKVRT